MRELRESARYNPARDRFKIWIIDEVHMLSTGAFNALLKTLEEPPPRVKFIFATTEYHKIPDTILSRCQQYDFRMIPARELLAHLRQVADGEKIQVSDESLARIARAAEGSARDALSLFDQVLSFSGNEVKDEDLAALLGLVDRELLLTVSQAVVEGNSLGLLDLVEKLSDYGADYKNFARELLLHYREILLVKLAPDSSSLLAGVVPEERARLRPAGRGLLGRGPAAHPRPARRRPTKSCARPRTRGSPWSSRSSRWCRCAGCCPSRSSWTGWSVSRRETPCLRAPTRAGLGRAIAAAVGSRPSRRRPSKHRPPPRPTGPRPRAATCARRGRRGGPTTCWRRCSRPARRAPRSLSPCARPRRGSRATCSCSRCAPDFAAFAGMHLDEYRDLAKAAAGRSLKVQIGSGAAAPEAPAAPSQEEVKKERLRQEAAREPAVQEALDLFDGKLLDVRETKPSR